MKKTGSKHRVVQELSWGTDIITIFGKKGTKIYTEVRENHIKGMYSVTNQVETALTEIEYIVFEITDELSYKQLPHFKPRDGDVLTVAESGSELASFYFNFFARGIVMDLKHLGYVKYRWKSYSSDKGEYPVYVDARGWEIAFNLGSICMTLLHKGLYLLVKKLRQLIKKQREA